MDIFILYYQVSSEKVLKIYARIYTAPDITPLSS